MKHHTKQRKLGREKDQRTALLRSLASSLIRDEKIKTTEAKAKEVRPFVEKLVTRGKKGDVHALRIIDSQLGGDTKGAHKKVNELAKKYEKRPGGYTRIIKLPPRQSDAAKMAVIEFV